MDEQTRNRFTEHRLDIGLYVLLIGFIAGLITMNRLTGGISNDQARLNQGIATCEGITMSSFDKCPITECHTESSSETGGSFTTNNCKIIGENDIEQQKKVNQQSIINEQRIDPVVLYFGSLACTGGIGLLLWELRERKKRAQS